MSEKQIDIRKKYIRELLDIMNQLNDLQQGKIYELSGAMTHGYLATNIIQIKKCLMS